MTIDKILLDHGSGGKLSHKLISEILVPIFDNPILSSMDDGAVFEIPKGKMAFSTDTYVVDPIFFPGGDIGELAVNGTVNDIAMCGASPVYLSAGLIIEEGFSIHDLEKILKTMEKAARKAKVYIVTGDTKVVPKGAADKIFINTSGIGMIYDKADTASSNAKPGDKIIISGTMADHGITILTQREGMKFDTSIKSDTAPLNHVVKNMLTDYPQAVHVLRDPTRGGVGTALNEIAESSKAGIKIYEQRLPVKKEVAGICELLGFDPLYIANEGKFIAVVSPDMADQVLKLIHEDEYGRDACIIGQVTDDHPGRVFMETSIGGTRIVDMLTGEQLPRIC
ncbi:hydrogenase expression/formation protein HypE [Desulfonema limicola]|nr:hydrogenase expression/formation protein HypE [Desulfonema limicola]